MQPRSTFLPTLNLVFLLPTFLLTFLPMFLLILLLAGAAQAKTLKIATVVPDGSTWLVEMRKAGAEIEARTEGRVKLKFYPGGVMGNEKTVLRKMRAGQLQGGAFTSGALAQIYPDAELYSLPLLFRSYGEVDHVRKHMDQSIRDGLAKKGFEALAISDSGFAYVMSQRPVREVGDLKGAKVWIVEGDLMSEVAFDIAGVSPIPLPIADVYTALQTHLIDTVAAPPMATIAFQWHTKVTYLTEVPLMYLVGIVAVDRKVFDKLSPGDQKILRETIAASATRLDADSRIGEENAKQALQNQGIEFVTASSAAEVQRWHDISAQALVKLREMGRYSETMISELLRLIEEYRVAHPEPR
ncbi:MAG: TRAP transporter substrate-binding protein DctP [Deltaproteobacteria bacterium]|nr:TRAP transporter substrate-binding protein DctP [Deltaproteobacteria bacterium]